MRRTFVIRLVLVTILITGGLLLGIQQAGLASCTGTNCPPTETPKPPSATVKPTSTSVPPTDTSVPPTNTPRPSGTPSPSDTPKPSSTPDFTATVTKLLTSSPFPSVTRYPTKTSEPTWTATATSVRVKHPAKTELPVTGIFSGGSSVADLVGILLGLGCILLVILAVRSLRKYVDKVK